MPVWLADLKIALLRRARILFGLTLACAGLGYTGSWHWFAELFSHFFIQYWLAGMLLLGVFLWARSWRWALAALAWLIVSSLALAPFYGRTGNLPVATQAGLSVLQFNVAQQQGPLEAWLVAEREPDLMLLMEVTPAFAPLLEGLRDRYPHQLLRLQEGPFGIALLSRFPFVQADVIEPVGADYPGLDVRLERDGRSLRLLGIHPPPPLGPELAGLRDRYMTQLAGLLRPGERTLVLGDFNATIWSPRLRAFTGASALQDCQRGLGLAPTWPAAAAGLPGAGGLLGIPIDLCLHSGGVQVQERRVGGNLGSDHLPVLNRIAF